MAEWSKARYTVTPRGFKFLICPPQKGPPQEGFFVWDPERLVSRSARVRIAQRTKRRATPMRGDFEASRVIPLSPPDKKALRAGFFCLGWERLDEVWFDSCPADGARSARADGELISAANEVSELTPMRGELAKQASHPSLSARQKGPPQEGFFVWDGRGSMRTLWFDSCPADGARSARADGERIAQRTK